MKLQRNLGGLRRMTKLPEAVFILDTKKEHIGVTEANKLHIPIVAVVDTNCDPDVIQFVIPGNDDAIRSGTLMCRIIADAVDEGRFIAARRNPRVAAGGPPPRDAADDARVAAEQAEARKQAAAAAADREAACARGPSARTRGRGSRRRDCGARSRGRGARSRAPDAAAPAEPIEATPVTAEATPATTEE